MNYSNLGSAYGNMNDYKDAIDCFKKALELNPSDPRTLYFLSITYKSMGDLANAKLFEDKYRATQKK